MTTNEPKIKSDHDNFRKKKFKREKIDVTQFLIYQIHNEEIRYKKDNISMTNL